MRLLKRIANRHYGMKENNMIRLVQAFVISRIVYVIPYLRLQVAEREKIDRIIRRVFKQAIGLPITTSNDKLLQLGLHNTSEELIEAQRIAQYEKLTQSKTGRAILEELGIVSGSVRMSFAEEAEEAAIAMAIGSTSTSLIVSDSQTAVRNFARGRISQIALRILVGCKDQRTIEKVWAPAHSSLPGNEAAHQTARGLTDRASGLPWSNGEDDERFERMTTYRDITQYYRLSRKIYPPAHLSLNKG
ncbi:uncharacterized protein LOC142802619 [Rhipicephalus microplus]|uniref:uncharacterized protein LOC142802619 n=1 Tax=Rhipicephalus microplus TaxID=6941 RepID=UPI003F6D2EF7